MNYNFAKFKHISVAVKKSSARQKKKKMKPICIFTPEQSIHNLHTINLVTSREKDVT